MNRKSNSFSNGPEAGGASVYHGRLLRVVHGWFCACHWCLTGVRS